MNRTNFPGRKLEKQKSAVARQKLHDALTTQQKLDKLDRAFGVGNGASKERVKLILQLNKERTQAKDTEKK